MPFSDIVGQERAKAILQASIQHDRIAHAYLFFGEPDIGKRLTAVRFIQAINCEAGSEAGGPDACGRCRACQQIEARTHPDVVVVEPDPERATPQIKIEQIRELEHYLVYRPLIGRRKACLIDEADRMTLPAANALLKTLEEPPSHSLFVLVSSRPSALPATVRSRCHALRFGAPAATQVEAALILKRALSPDDARFLTMLTEAKIGRALATDVREARAQWREAASLIAPETLASVPRLLETAETLAKSDRGGEALDSLSRVIRELLLARVGADSVSRLGIDFPQGLDATGASVDGLLDVLESIDRFQRAATRNLNPQLLLESVLLRLRDCLVPPVAPDPTRTAPDRSARTR